MKNILFYLGLSVALFSCQQTKEFSDGEVKVLRIKNAVDAKLWDFTTDFKLIPLEYKGDESIVSTIKKLRFENGKFYILDTSPMGNASLKVFDGQGKFISSIRQVNSKSLITSEIKDFYLDDQGLLFVLDTENNVIQLGDAFEYVKHISYNTYIENIFFSDGKVLLFSNDQAINFQPDSLMYNYVVLEEGSTNSKFQKFEIEEFTSRTISSLFGGIQPAAEGFLITEFLNDTIYSLDNKLEPEFYIDFGALSYNPSDFPKAKVQAFSPILMDNYSWGISNPIRFDNNFHFSYFEKNVPISVIYSEEKSTLFKFNPIDVLRDENVGPMPKYYDGEFFYAFASEAGFGNLEGIENYSENSTMKMIYDHITRNSNPVIMKFKLEF
jgi:hypothetical protein